jgi:hypothetical protein
VIFSSDIFILLSVVVDVIVTCLPCGVNRIEV